jgi:hypothetical protein
LKYQITRFKNLHLALKELEPFIRNGEHLQTGKPFKRFGGLRSRELLANWLLCVAVDQNRLTFTSDPLGGDGIIFDKITEETWPTEYILVPAVRVGKASETEDLILSAINKKQEKGGAAYASGKTLIVFLNAGGDQEWFPNKVAKKLPQPLDFEAVWVVGLYKVDNGSYIYGVTRLDLRQGNAPTWLIKISPDFDSWEVSVVQ